MLTNSLLCSFPLVFYLKLKMLCCSVIVCCKTKVPKITYCWKVTNGVAFCTIHLFLVRDNIKHIFPLNDDYKQTVVTLSALICVLQQLKRKHNEIRQKINWLLCVGTSIKIIMLSMWSIFINKHYILRTLLFILRCS